MPTPLDIFTAPEFTDPRLSELINIPPYFTGRPAQLGLFRDTPIPTTYVKLGISQEEITIIPARERGGPANKNLRAGRDETMFAIPHFPLDDAIGPSDMQNILQWGNNYIYEAVENVYNQKLNSMRTKHDATHSHLDWGALGGNVVDGEGKVLLNLFTQFGITQDTQGYALSNAATDVAGLNRAVKAKIRFNLHGAPMGEVRVFAGAEWFDAYVSHATIKDAYKYFAAAPGQVNPLRDDIAEAFPFAGLNIERIQEEFQFRNENGSFTVKEAVPVDEAIAIPLGTPYFRRYIAPPDSITEVNRPPGQKIFVSTDDLPHGKGREIHTESNVLPICVRPQIIMRLTKS